MSPLNLATMPQGNFTHNVILKAQANRLYVEGDLDATKKEPNQSELARERGQKMGHRS